MGRAEKLPLKSTVMYVRLHTQGLISPHWTSQAIQTKGFFTWTMTVLSLPIMI